MRTKNFGAMVASAVAGMVVSGAALAKDHCEAMNCASESHKIEGCAAAHDCKGKTACGTACTQAACEKDGAGKWVKGGAADAAKAPGAALDSAKKAPGAALDGAKKGKGKKDKDKKPKP